MGTNWHSHLAMIAHVHADQVATAKYAEISHHVHAAVELLHQLTKVGRHDWRSRR